MEDILVFIINNLFPILIALGILSSILGRFQRKGGGNRMPNFGGGTGGAQPPSREPDRPFPSGGDWPVSPESPRLPEVAHPEAPWRPDPADDGGPAFPRDVQPGRRTDDQGQVIIADVRPNRANGMTSAYAHAALTAGAMAASRETDLATARSAEASRVAPAMQVEQRSVRPIAGPDELRKAVLWAEILGPPRSRHPLGRRFGR